MKRPHKYGAEAVEVDPFDGWEWREFPIATHLGIRHVLGWVNDMLAVHRGIGHCRGCWVLTHLPTGFSFSTKAVFPNAEAGVIFADRLRPSLNNWRNTDSEYLDKVLRAPVDRLVDEYGLSGRVTPLGDDNVRVSVSEILGDIYGGPS